MKTKRMFNESIAALALVLPAIIYYSVFWIRPVYSAIIEAFTDVSGNFSLDTYIRLFSNPDMKKALINTFVFVLCSMVVQFFLSIGIALLLNKKFKFANLILFISLIPMALPPTAVGILWKSGLYKTGWLNSFLYTIGVLNETNLIDWISFSGLKAVLMLVVVDTWTVVPSMVIIILAGLQNLNKEYEEAGWVFGANKLQTIKDIVIPIMKPTIITAMILRLIASIQVWLIAVMILGYNTTPFLVERIAYYVDVITMASDSSKNAYATSVFVAVIVLIASTVYIRVSEKKNA